MRSNLDRDVLDSAMDSHYSGGCSAGGKNQNLSTASSSDPADKFSYGDDEREVGENPGCKCDEASSTLDNLECSVLCSVATATTAATTVYTTCKYQLGVVVQMNCTSYCVRKTLHFID
jgi:hypothetical protein